ncbi:MAG TPA: dihydroorotate dehydrogenase [Dehalococcoidia bacterium]|nr:dihydroorotate dehydrogenase [Dehalococcoidia bacterium]
MNLKVELAPKAKRGLLLSNPVMTASGTFSYGLEIGRAYDLAELGAIVSKGTTLHPRRGNPQPRTWETPAGMLNAIGLQNIGVEAVIREMAPLWARWRVPVIVNIAGETVEEFAELAARLDAVPAVSGLEVNIGCPNARAGGLEFSADPEQAAAVTRGVVTSTSLPVIVKLSPLVTDMVATARAVAAAGADALCVANTVPAMAIDIHRRRPALAWGQGGLSGPAIKPIALRLVYRVAGAVDIPVIGCGGIATGEDAIEFLMAGATAVQVGTASFFNPRAPWDILEGVRDFLAREGVEDIGDIIGAAHLDGPRPKP